MVVFSAGGDAIRSEYLAQQRASLAAVMTEVGGVV
jgi:hypothetical protein